MAAATEFDAHLAAAREALANAQQVKQQLVEQAPEVKREAAALGWWLQDDRLAERFRAALRLRWGVQ